MNNNIDERVEKILKDYELDFLIEKAPLKAKMESGAEYITPYYGLVNLKTKETINTVKEGYGVSQNGEIVKMVLLGVEKFGAELSVNQAGSLNGGRQVYIQLKIEGKNKFTSDSIIQYITIIDSNDGSTSLSVGIGDKVMSCRNQFYYFYSQGNAKFRHTATIEEKIKSIPPLIEKALAESMKQIGRYQTFQSTPLTKHLADSMVQHVLGYDRVLTSEEKRKELTPRSVKMMDSLYEHISKETIDKGDNVWGLFSGVTSWTTHEKKGPNRINGDIEGRLKGKAYEINLKAFNFAANHAGILVPQ